MITKTAITLKKKANYVCLARYLLMLDFRDGKLTRLMTTSKQNLDRELIVRESLIFKQYI